MISRSGVHALRALATLAALGNDEYAGAAAVAERVGAPANYLGKLLQTLARHGIVASRKGAGGGFRLARPADRITLLEVIEPIEPLSSWRRCFLGSAICSDDTPCALHAEWGPLRDGYLAFLSRNTIADVARGPMSDGRAPERRARGGAR